MVRYDKSTAARGAKYVEDRRGSGGRRRVGPSSTGGKAVGGIGGLILLILGALFGIPALSGGDGATTNVAEGVQTEQDAETKEFMEFLMFDIQDTWDIIFDQAGVAYEPTRLVIFDGVVDSGCGRATSAVGPFYCPAPGDNKVYVDFAFYNDLARRFGAPGDFAQAYVIAHEVGHHIQAITGWSDQIRAAQQAEPNRKNYYSIRQELQADCFAGVWASSANERMTRETNRPIIEIDDLEEGLQAAEAVGDDRIQAQAGMTIDPHTWTHGSAEQRRRWFLLGFDSGDPEACDPFSVENP